MFPFETHALRVIQPIGEFFVVVLPARLLLQVAESDVMSATLQKDGVGYSLSGTQRVIQDKRLSQIADYINRSDASFPNSVILAANYNRDFGIDQGEVEEIVAEESEESDFVAAAVENPTKSWAIVGDDEESLRLRIPTNAKLAAIIDGQHRLFAFVKADPARLDMNLICAVFLDLPKPFQAQLFATINSTQKPVDRSLTFELFGYNVAEEPESSWSPDKLAVFLTRRLGTETGSPMRGRIVVRPKKDILLQAMAAESDWDISTAVVVDGILRLISSNPKRDSNAMCTPVSRPRSALREGPKDRSPLRDLFIDGNDRLIYAVVEHYLAACNIVFWRDAQRDSYILKTVGIQALFDILRKLAPAALADKDLRIEYFEEKLRPAGDIDFSEAEFRIPSGSGRSAIRRALENLIRP